MDAHYLAPLFSPRSVAVIGASDTPDSIGQIVFQNMLDGGYKGRLYAINPKRREVQGQPCYASIDEVDAPIDLVVIATPPATVPDIIEACGRREVKAAVIISAGFAETGAGLGSAGLGATGAVCGVAEDAATRVASSRSPAPSIPAATVFFFSSFLAAAFSFVALPLGDLPLCAVAPSDLPRGDLRWLLMGLPLVAASGVTPIP